MRNREKGRDRQIVCVCEGEREKREREKVRGSESLNERPTESEQMRKNEKKWKKM